jgi:aminoglycoside phosphotransferase (APT) family kinase protein
VVTDPVDELLRRHGLHAPWTALPATGIANRIYATAQVVVRVASDHEEAIPDARTESVAAPVARAAGVRTPRLLAWDDSRTLVDRPFSIWERVHGATLGQLAPSHELLLRAWRDVAREHARLHRAVRECPAPRGWLDRPERPADPRPRLAAHVSAGHIFDDTARRLGRWVERLLPAIAASTTARFLHHDLHGMNVMAREDGALLALLDWGDAGWGDPTLDLGYVPLEALDAALAAYEAEAPGLLGDAPEARLLWDRIARVASGLDRPCGDERLGALLRFAAHAPPRFAVWLD